MVALQFRKGLNAVQSAANGDTLLQHSSAHSDLNDLFRTQYLILRPGV